MRQVCGEKQGCLEERIETQVSEMYVCVCVGGDSAYREPQEIQGGKLAYLEIVKGREGDPSDDCLVSKLKGFKDQEIYA